MVRNVFDKKGNVTKNQTFDVEKTFCAITLEASSALGIADVKNSEWKKHPCNDTGLESYIGVPVSVNQKPFGTLNFSSPTPKPSPFADIDLEFIITLGDWVSNVLSRFEKSE